jgi:hypothetical protein
VGLFTPGSDIIAGLLRGKPNLPGFTQIDPGQEQQKAINENAAVTPELEKQASGINKFNQDQLTRMLQQAIPGYEALKSQTSSNIESMLKGEIPDDVKAAVINGGAAKALGGGYGGSGAHGDLVARDLGLTSLSLTQQGITSAEAWMKTVSSLETPALYDFSKMFITPGQQLEADTGERNAKFQHDWTQNQIDWQSSLGFLAGNEIQTDSSQLNSMVGSVAGSAAGAAGGGGGL